MRANFQSDVPLPTPFRIDFGGTKIRMCEGS
jgi:hypothetical protein